MAKYVGNVVKYKGLTKRQYKRVYKSSTPGSEKQKNCKKTGIEKALTIYPRAYRTMWKQYNALMKVQHIQGKFGTSSMFMHA